MFGGARAQYSPRQAERISSVQNRGMNIVILDDYQDVVRKLACAKKLQPYVPKVFTNTVKGIGQLSVRLKDAEALVLIRERTHITKQLIEKLPNLKLISQTGKSAAMSMSLPAPSAALWWSKAWARPSHRPNSPGHSSWRLCAACPSTSAT